MSLQITGKNFDVDAKTKETIENKLNNFKKFNVPFINENVVIEEEPHKNFKVSVSIVVPDSKIEASATNHEVHIAVTEVLQKVERQINKLIHKPDSHRSDKGLKKNNYENTLEENVIEERDQALEALKDSK